MNCDNLTVLLFAVLAMMLGTPFAQRADASPAAGAASGGLRLLSKIQVPGMTGTWDHMSVDANTGRLFVSAQDQQVVEVVDLLTKAPIYAIAGAFDRPQGELFLSDLNRLIVTNGRSGLAQIIDGSDYRLLGTVQLSVGADMIAYDARARQLYIESGGTDSKRGPGGLSIVDPIKGTIAGRLVTGYRAAALVMEHTGTRLYAAIPASDEIAVIDTKTGNIANRFKVPGRPASMALDEAGHRLFVATRSFAGDPRPPTFNIINADTGQPVASLPSKDATENMYFDAMHAAVYSSSLEGFVQVYRQAAHGHYNLAATIPTVAHAGTSQFVPELDLFCVAVPPQDGHAAAIWVFRPTD